MITVGLCQMNPWVGNLSHNLEKVKGYFKSCQTQEIDLVIFPECAITGYPLEDLVIKPHFLEKVEQAIDSLLKVTVDHKTAVIIGAPWLQEGTILNTALFIQDGKIHHVIPKHMLPNYGVFDEKRVYESGSMPEPVSFKGLKLGIMICEDMWFPNSAQHLKAQGADVLIVLNGSPFDLTKHERRLFQAKERIKETGLPLIYVNIVGGQDNLVFDGRSFVMDAYQKTVLEMLPFQESLSFVKINKSLQEVTIQPLIPYSKVDMIETELLYSSLLRGLKDYVEKNNFKGVLIGLSGGIDSALAAAIAVDALGADQVQCVMMPSLYTSPESLEDAKFIADYLKVSYDILSIEPAMLAYQEILKDKFKNTKVDSTEENIQSRARGMILMALSNKTGYMVLSTGNKSEMAVGYATLYGDMCGGYNALKDVYKIQVFALARWRNLYHHPDFLGPKGTVMPERVITKPPSAELKPDQKDQDSLPPYEILDAVLHDLIEEDLSVEDIVAKGFEAEEVIKIYHLLERAEYKRRQAPPGPKITVRALTSERRYPITNGFLLSVL
jgi:NAD+ synthase